MDVFGELCDLVVGMGDLQGLLEGVAGVAAARMTQATGSKVECSVVLHRGRRPAVAAGSDGRVRSLESVTQILDEGSGRGTGEPEPVLLMVSPDSPWPGQGREAGVRDFKGFLGIALEPGPGASVRVNFFAAEPGALAAGVVSDAMALARECCRALALALRIADAEQKSEDLAAALDHRTPIDLARGILMAQNRCTAEEAFEVLSVASSNRNQKLHEVALEVATRFAYLPGPAHFKS